MKITNHLLSKDSPSEKINQKPTQNIGSLIDPDYLILHYTAGDTAQGTIDWFMNRTSNTDRLAAHLVIDYDGTITQMVPFNRRANHAGSSAWDNTEFFNNHSIGIEIVNPGCVKKNTDGTYSRPITSTKVHTYPASRSKDIIQANHKHLFWNKELHQHWFKYPKAQMEAVYAVSKLLMQHYQLVQCLGHDDISVARKSDPGPAFPWSEFNTAVLGADNMIGRIMKVTETGTNFRSNPSTNSSVIKKLSIGYEVGVVETVGSWYKVYLCNTTSDVLVKGGGSMRSVKNIGYIHSSLLQPK